VEETLAQTQVRVRVYYYSVKKTTLGFAVFGLVLSTLLASYLALRSLMELFEDSETLWDLDLDLEE
jgi:hypothetical protein